MLPTLIRRTRNWDVDRPLSLLNEFDSFFNRLNEGDDYGTVGAYPVDIHEDEQSVFVEAELPGFDKSDIDVTLENGVLRITAQRQNSEKKGESHLAERRFTRVARSFQLPTEVNENSVEASLTGGVLHLKLNKREEAKPKKIKVR